MKTLTKSNLATSRIAKLTKDRKTFFSYAVGSATPHAFAGPSRCLYEEVLRQIKEETDYPTLLVDTHFMVSVYATLPAWGMHRSGSRGPKMGDLSDFRKSIVSNMDILSRLSRVRLSEGVVLATVDNDLQDVFNSLQVMKTDSKLVGNSKTMHFLLPHLIPPMDREYTLRFFFDGKNLDSIESNVFLTIFDYYKQIQKSLQLIDKDCRYVDTPLLTVPKLIDDAIIGFVSRELK